MTSKNLHEIIKLLEHIERNPNATQRELVDKLDISLGKVNFLINSLVERGMIKLKRFTSSRNKRGYLYLLTPQGIKRKTEIMRKFLEQKVEEYDRLNLEIEELKGSILRIDRSDELMKR